jgi:hypothetical protein
VVKMGLSDGYVLEEKLLNGNQGLERRPQPVRLAATVVDTANSLLRGPGSDGHHNLPIYASARSLISDIQRVRGSADSFENFATLNTRK